MADEEVKPQPIRAEYRGERHGLRVCIPSKGWECKRPNSTKREAVVCAVAVYSARAVRRHSVT
eukprot:scaffold72023_cov31-Tisochrysis_lutea.AAC.2